MNIWYLLVREIWYRKVNFGLALLSVIVAVGCLVAQLTQLQLFDDTTEALLAAREAELKKELAKHEDDTRKTMVKLGFHVLIVPKDQDRGQLYEHDFATAVMP